MNEHPFSRQLIIAVSIVIGSHFIYQFIFLLVKRWGRKKTHQFPRLLQKHLLVPGHFFVLAIALFAALPVMRYFLHDETYGGIQHLLKIAMMAAGGFLIMRVAAFLRDLAVQRYKSMDSSDFSYRKARTKFQLLQRVFNAIVILATVALILTTFENVRQIGSTLLASAGVAGIIIGFAAQRSLSSLFAGIQIAISQPIRIDDVVVVEDEFGTIGEINLTYVVINTWDGRRKIVPINYFLEKSFENWTRVSPEVVGKVKIYVDYSLPLEGLRKEFERWLNDTPLWDKRKSGLLVTDANDKTMEVRATMSARNSDDAWDLECLIREKMITYVRENYPEALPANRLKVQNITENKNCEHRNSSQTDTHRPGQNNTMP